MKESRRRTARIGTAGVLAVAVVASGALVWDASYAAFTATTTNPGNTWSAGSVIVGNDRNGVAVFTQPATRPDAATSTLAPPANGAFTASDPAAGGSACIKVTYTGTLTADIRMHVAITNTGADGGLAQFLLFDVDNGTGPAGSDPTCAGFTSTGYLYGSASNTGDLLTGMPTAYAGGLAGWAGATNGDSKWYRLSWLLPKNVADAAQLEGSTVKFTWEAQNV